MELSWKYSKEQTPPAPIIEINLGGFSIELVNVASDKARDKYSDSFPRKLEACKTMACEIVATFAVQKGIESADAVDIFRADLDNYLELLKKKDLEHIDRDELAKRLSSLSDMANQFAKKEYENRSKTPYTISVGPTKY